jgi:hypothetical protein
MVRAFPLNRTSYQANKVKTKEDMSMIGGLPNSRSGMGFKIQHSTQLIMTRGQSLAHHLILDRFLQNPRQVRPGRPLDTYT